MKKIAVTGHTNIEKGYGLPIPNNGTRYDIDIFKEVTNQIDLAIKSLLDKYDELELVCGMARGIDEIFGLYALKNNIPLTLFVPASVNWYRNRGFSRGIKAQAVYFDKLLSGAKSVYEIEKGSFNYVNMARNEAMIEYCDGLLSYKRYNSNGTNDAILRGTTKNKYVGNIDDGIQYYKYWQGFIE